jgi:hypothetical protein
MNLTTGRTKLHNSLETLTLRWEDTRAGWNDPVRVDFEENCWVNLEAHTNFAIRAIDRLSQTLAQLKRECS